VGGAGAPEVELAKELKNCRFIVRKRAACSKSIAEQ